jgi:hypothetical protein
MVVLPLAVVWLDSPSWCSIVPFAVVGCIGFAGVDPTCQCRVLQVGLLDLIWFVDSALRGQREFAAAAAVVTVAMAVVSTAVSVVTVAVGVAVVVIQLRVFGCASTWPLGSGEAYQRGGREIKVGEKRATTFVVARFS